MPGTLLAEAMSQTMVISITSMEDYIDDLKAGVLLNEITNLKLLSEATPNMNLVFHAKITSMRRGVVKGTISCKSNEKLICSSEQTLIIPKLFNQFIK